MKAEIKRRWVAALRGGKYRQTRTKLREGDTYCVLGVLCDLHDPDGWVPEFTEIGNWARIERDGFVLPTPIRNAVGLGPDDVVSLYCMNDRGASFTELADYIEEAL